MSPREQISQIDKQIDAVHRELLSFGRFNTLSAADWQAAWDKHPDLRTRDLDLYRQRGVAQDASNALLAAAAMKAARAARFPRSHKCPTCGARKAA